MKHPHDWLLIDKLIMIVYIVGFIIMTALENVSMQLFFLLMIAISGIGFSARNNKKGG